MKPKSRLLASFVALILAVSATALTQHGQQGQQRSQIDRQRPAGVERSDDRRQTQGRDRADQQSRQEVQDQDKEMAEAQQRGRDMYGYELMTEQERNEYRQQLEKAETEQARQQIISEHRAKMQARAKDKGVDLEETEESE